jgi:hypothetical protein
MEKDLDTNGSLVKFESYPLMVIIVEKVKEQ